MKRLLLTALCASLTALSTPSYSQEREIAALLGQSGIEDIDENEYERLSRLYNDPLRVNMSADSRIISCGLFSRYQAAVLLDYRNTHGDILSFTELSVLDGFSEEYVRLLKPFISLSSDKKGLGTSELREDELTAKGELRKKEDFQYSYGMKYRHLSDRGLSLSFATRRTVESKTAAPETWSFNASGEMKRLGLRITAGDFNARFGQGLMLWNGMSMGSVPKAAALARRPSGISASWSYSPDGPIRGIAADGKWGKYSCSAVCAFSGLRELMDGDKDRKISGVGALNLSRTGRTSELGLSVLCGRGGSSTKKGIAKIGSDVRWTPGEVEFFGEAGWDLITGSIALIGGAMWTIDYGYRISAAGRRYPAEWEAAFAGGYKAGSSCRDESGITLAFSLPWMNLSWDRAVMSGAAKVKDRAFADAEVKLGEEFRLLPKLSFRMTEKGGDIPPRIEFKLDSEWARVPWLVRIRTDLVYCRKGGVLVYGECGRKSDRFGVYLRGTVFWTGHWDDRIYVYERDAPGNFNVPAYSGKGGAGSLVLFWKNRLCRADLRLEKTVFRDGNVGRTAVRGQVSFDLKGNAKARK